MRTDGRTERHDEANSRFSQLFELAEKSVALAHSGTPISTSFSRAIRRTFLTHSVFFLFFCFWMLLCYYFEHWPRRFNGSETEAKRTQRSVKPQRTSPVIPVIANIGAGYVGTGHKLKEVKKK
jgi:hypothetical protein